MREKKQKEKTYFGNQTTKVLLNRSITLYVSKCMSQSYFIPSFATKSIFRTQ